MKYRWAVVAVVAVLPAIVLAGGAFGHGASHNKIRFDYVTKNQIPAKYRELLNPLPINEENLTAGKALYGENCAACHGAAGDGRGEAAEGLQPPAAVLTGMYGKAMVGAGSTAPAAHLMHGELHHHPGISHAEAMGGLNIDAYSFWTTADGGEKLGSSMPAFGEILSEKEMWQILLYVAGQFSAQPAAEGTGN